MLLSNSKPAQSRLLPLAVALCVLLASSPSRSAHATPDDALGPPVLDADPGAVWQHEHNDPSGQGSGGYAPNFAYFDRGLLGRQDDETPETIVLTENGKTEQDIDPGTTLFFVLKKGSSRLIRADDEAALEALEARDTAGPSAPSLDQGAAAEDVDTSTWTRNTSSPLAKRQAASSIWLSANTCRQPNPPLVNDGPASMNNPQLVMYISTSSKNQFPGPASTDDLATPPTGLLFENGFASYAIQANSDVYIGISAPNLENGWFGSWHFELAASSSGFYHSYEGNDPFLYMVDTDSNSALFITYTLSEPGTNDTEKWIQNNPFKMYAFEYESVTNITGLERSMCAVQYYNQSTNVTMRTSITTRFGDRLPKGQFHLQGLKPGKQYNGFLTISGQQEELQLPGPGNTTIRGGGMIFQQFNFTTKQDDNCQVIFDLDFCESVAYAVPSNPTYKGDNDKLKALYDGQAQSYYRNFTNSLAQVACDVVPESQYSLARNCTDCATDYKNWLCTVLIPRCTDWSAPGSFLQERNINAPLPDGSLTFQGNVSAAFNETMRNRLAYNNTRNPGIDQVTPLGPYKELLPCEDLCFDIVRSCPAQLGFACPNFPARALTYGKRDPADIELRCNFPGAVVKLNIQGAAAVQRVSMGVLLGMLIFVLVIVMR
ncbi:hypothetical protein ACEQ8H_000616 [Pleosporales sp. CAS-2024a]